MVEKFIQRKKRPFEQTQTMQFCDSTDDSRQFGMQDCKITFTPEIAKD